MFQHITWPDFGIPKDLFSIFELIHVVSQINSNCMLVHCSAGVGRTGVFFALAKLIETFHSDAHYLNIFQTVLELRKSRKFMVWMQYFFIFTNYNYFFYFCRFWKQNNTIFCTPQWLPTFPWSKKTEFIMLTYYETFIWLFYIYRFAANKSCNCQT